MEIYQFAEFVEYLNLFDYIKQLCRKEKNMNMKITDLQVSWQKEFFIQNKPNNPRTWILMDY
tara:strand:- start:395 stop:580 length:186 start_codon:yes stop_codon:yes gene_type:complete